MDLCKIQLLYSRALKSMSRNARQELIYVMIEFVLVVLGRKDNTLTQSLNNANIVILVCF